MINSFTCLVAMQYTCPGSIWLKVHNAKQESIWLPAHQIWISRGVSQLLQCNSSYQVSDNILPLIRKSSSFLCYTSKKWITLDSEVNFGTEHGDDLFLSENKLLAFKTKYQGYTFNLEEGLESASDVHQSKGLTWVHMGLSSICNHESHLMCLKALR